MPRAYTLDTIVPPVDYPPLITDPARQRRDPTWGFAYAKAGSGNNGKDSGSLFVLVNTVESLRADTTGQRGQDGGDSPAGVPYTVVRCSAPGACTSYEYCSFDGKQDPVSGGPITTGLMDGGDGGKGGQAGNAFVRFATILGVGERPRTDAECFATADACATAACGWNPSNTVCDYQREADDRTCSDKVNNDADSRIDCDQDSCRANPHVGRCGPAPVEGTVLVDWVACSGAVYRPTCNGPGQPSKTAAAPILSLGAGVKERVSSQLSFKLSVGDSGLFGMGPGRRTAHFAMETGARPATTKRASTSRAGRGGTSTSSDRCSRPGNGAWGRRKPTAVSRKRSSAKRRFFIC